MWKNSLYVLLFSIILFVSCSSKEEKLNDKIGEIQSKMEVVNNSIDSIGLEKLLRKLEEINDLAFIASKYTKNIEEVMSIDKALYPFRSVNDLIDEIALIKKLLSNQEIVIEDYLRNLIEAESLTDLRNRKSINQNSGYLLMSSYLANGKYKEAEMLGVNSYIQGDYYKQYAYQFHKIIDYYYKENQIEDLFSFKIKDEYYLSLVYNMITENIKELSEAKRILTEYFSFKNYPPTFFLEDIRSFHVKLLAFYDLSVAQEEFKKNYDFYLTLRNDEDDYSSQYLSYINNLLDTDLLPFIKENFQVYTENVSHSQRQTIYKNIIFKDIEINKRTREYIDENLNQIYESFVYMKSCTYTPDNDESRTTFYYFVNEDYQQFLKELSKQMMKLNRLDDYIYYYDKSQLVENIGPGKIQFLPDSIEKGVYYWIQNKKEEADFHFSGKAIEASRHKIYEPEDVYYETILGIANLNQTSLVYELLDHATSIEFRKAGAKRKKEAILSEIYLKLKNYDKAYDYALIGYWQNYLPLRDMNFEYRDTDRLKKLTNCYLQNAWEIHSHIRYLLLILLECKEYVYIEEALKDFQEDPVARVFYLYAKYKENIMKNGRMDILRLHNDTDNYFEKVQSFLVYYEEYQQSKVIMNDEELMIIYFILSGRY